MYRNERGLILDPANPDMWGPLNEYDERVKTHQLREDEHQRGRLFEHPGGRLAEIHESQESCRAFKIFTICS